MAVWILWLWLGMGIGLMKIWGEEKQPRQEDFGLIERLVSNQQSAGIFVMNAINVHAKHLFAEKHLLFSHVVGS